MSVRARRPDYAVAVDREGRASADGKPPARWGPEWTAEHLLLAALARCSLAALSYHARRSNLWLVASAEARGAVTRREDGLLARAERGCFVGASLEPRSRYLWRVNGADASPRAAPS